MKENKNLIRVKSNSELFTMMQDGKNIVLLKRIKLLTRERCGDNIFNTALVVANGDTDIVKGLGMINACKAIPTSFEMLEIRHREDGVTAIPIGKHKQDFEWFSIEDGHNPNYAIWHYNFKNNDYIIKTYSIDGKVEFVTVYLIIK